MSGNGATLVKIAVGQMTSTADKLKNVEVCRTLARHATDAGAELLALPECFSFIGENWRETVRAAEPLEGPTMSAYCKLAKEAGLWLSLGGFQEQASANLPPSPADCAQSASPESHVDKVFNTHVIISNEGDIVATYRKIHLFDVDIPDGPTLMESKFTKPGRHMSICKGTALGNLGLSTCYDLRFPEMYACLAIKGAQIMLVPSAFTVPTGEAHWEVLLRARAIETQAYVVASAQVGRHNTKRQSYGHSLIVDPWGKVLVDVGGNESPGIGILEIDLNKVDEVRRSMPLQIHRKAAGPLFAEEMLQEMFGRSGL